MRGSSNGRRDDPQLKLYYRCPGRTHVAYARDCCLPNFRTDWVDAQVWQWVKSFFIYPEALDHGLREVQQQRDQETRPIKERLAMVEGLLAENRGKLERLLDLYLSGEFAREILGERKALLEKTVSDLVREQAELAVHLEKHMVSVEHRLRA